MQKKNCHQLAICMMVVVGFDRKKGFRTNGRQTVVKNVCKVKVVGYYCSG